MPRNEICKIATLKRSYLCTNSKWKDETSWILEKNITSAKEKENLKLHHGDGDDKTSNTESCFDGRSPRPQWQENKSSKNSSAVVIFILIEKVKLENPAILSPLSVGKVQSWIAKAEAERFPESLTPLPPFPQPPPPWLEQGWHGRWDSNAGVGGPTKLEGPPPHHEIPSTGPPRPTMATTLFFTRRKYYLPHLEDGTVDFRSKYLGLLGYTQPTNHTASLGSNWCYNDWGRVFSFFRVKQAKLNLAWIRLRKIHTNLTKGPHIKFADLVFERLHVSSFWQEDLIKISAFEKNKITSQVLLSNTTCRSPPIRIITCTMISLTRVLTITFYWWTFAVYVGGDWWLYHSII